MPSHAAASPMSHARRIGSPSPTPRCSHPAHLPHQRHPCRQRPGCRHPAWRGRRSRAAPGGAPPLPTPPRQGCRPTQLSLRGSRWMDAGGVLGLSGVPYVLAAVEQLRTKRKAHTPACCASSGIPRRQASCPALSPLQPVTCATAAPRNISREISPIISSITAALACT